MNQKLLALYGLKWNPFSPELPTEALYIPARIESFCWRIEQALIREGGFAMIHGDPGTGKSVALRVLAQRLARLPDITVGVVSHPQSSLVDFYRELGDIFAVPLKPHNRWGGFKTLREVWFSHMETTRRRPVLLIDEAQEMSPAALSELRLLASSRFDSPPSEPGWRASTSNGTVHYRAARQSRTLCALSHSHSPKGRSKINNPRMISSVLAVGGRIFVNKETI
ncbi:MAG: ATP-binding protein [Betaproteobacteria bacterium]